MELYGGKHTADKYILSVPTWFEKTLPWTTELGVSRLVVVFSITNFKPNKNALYVTSLFNFGKDLWKTVTYHISSL